MQTQPVIECTPVKNMTDTDSCSSKLREQLAFIVCTGNSWTFETRDGCFQMFVRLCLPLPNTSHSCDVWPLLTPPWRPQLLGSSHRNRGGAENAPYLPSGEGRHSIRPPQCQNGDGDILGNLCFCTPPSILSHCVSVCLCVCVHLSSPSFPRKELRIYECMGRRGRHLQRRMSVSCKQLGGEGGGVAVCVCMCACVGGQLP